MIVMNYPKWKEMLGELDGFIKGSFGSRAPFPMVRAETPTFLGVPLVSEPEALVGADAVIIGAPYVATETDKYAGVEKSEWIAAPKRVRQ